MRRLAILTALVAAGCGGPSDLEPEIELAAQQALLGVEGSLHATQLMGPFQPALRLTRLPIEEVREQALADVLETFELAVQGDACLELETDAETFVELAFDACAFGLLGLLRVDGTLRADLELEVEPCAAGSCAVAVSYEVRAIELAIGNPRAPRSLVIDGTWAYRAELDRAGAQTLVNEVSYTGPAGNRLQISSEATWTVDGPCVNVWSDGRIDLVDDGDALLGGIAASMDGVRRCGAQCPERGEVYLAFARGDVVTWTYTGEDVVTVRAPGGREADVQLDCATP
jgi:hypothetical protein